MHIYPDHKTGVYTVLLICPMYNQKLSLYLCDCTLANRNIGVSSLSLSTISLSSSLSPDLEKKKKETTLKTSSERSLQSAKSSDQTQNNGYLHTRRVWSQEPVLKAVPSGETRSVLTRFSCPNKMETRVPLRTSQTFMV